MNLRGILYENNVAHYGSWHWFPLWRRHQAAPDGRCCWPHSIHDSIEAGFNHVVFVIRKDIEKEFREVIGDRIAAVCVGHGVTVDYAFQDLHDISGQLPEGRTKPWGTG